MKKRTRVAAAALALVVGTGTVALAASQLVSIQVLPGMNLSINGEAFVPKDVNGKEVDVFAYNGTTYVPIRAISEAFGMDVDYDAATQTAIVNEPEEVTPPYDPNEVEYVMSVAPELITNEDGTQQYWYNGVGYEFRWWLPEEQQDSFTVKLVEGTLPDGIKLVDGDRLEGNCLKAGTTDVTFTVTPKEGYPVTRTLRFQFVEPDELAVAPVVLWGAVGDRVEWYGIPSFYDGIFYTADDLTADNTDVEFADLGSSPIGTQAGLDALAEYGLTLTYDEQTLEDGYRRADNLLEGTFTKATDGWVKISVPVYASVGTNDPDYPLDQNFWLCTNDEGNTQLVYGNIDIYLNIIDFE